MFQLVEIQLLAPVGIPESISNNSFEVELILSVIQKK